MTPASDEQHKEADNDLIISRMIDAPRRQVFDAWTQSEQLAHWWGPIGCTTPHCKIDLRIGGKFHFCMRMPDGFQIWGLGVYREILEPERIAYTDSFSDAEGNLVLPSLYGMSEGYPSETLVTVTFSEVDGKSKLTLRHSVPSSFPERAGMVEGWKQMLDRLAELLERTPERPIP